MRLPTIIEAEKQLTETEQRNPGTWIGHSKTAAFVQKRLLSIVTVLTLIQPIYSACYTTLVGVRV